MPDGGLTDGEKQLKVRGREQYLCGGPNIALAY